MIRPWFAVVFDARVLRMTILGGTASMVGVVRYAQVEYLREKYFHLCGVDALACDKNRGMTQSGLA